MTHSLHHLGRVWNRRLRRGSFEAIEDFHQKDFRTDEQKEADKDGYLLYVTRAQSKSERLMELKDEQTDDDTLRSLFESFGTITSVCAMKAGHSMAQ
eukprot:Skav228523  [mRNA]  locus=scaffold796:57695:61023:+ [translate_table: standard]